MGYISARRIPFENRKQRQDYIKQGQRYRGHVMAARNKARRSRSVDDINYFIFMLSSEEQIGPMMRLIVTQPPHIFWPVFLTNWPRCDNTWAFNCVMPQALRRPGSAIEFLDAVDRAFFESLSDEVTVYRGCYSKSVNGISWTTDLRVAEGFAHGHRGIRVPDPVIAEGKISKSDIFAVFCGRQESEVLCAPEIVDIRPYKLG